MNKAKYILTTGECPEIYQYSIYKPEWILKVQNDFGDYYTGTVIEMSNNKNEYHMQSTIAVRKEDCEILLTESVNEENTNKKEKQ